MELSQLNEIANLWLKSFNARDLDALLKLYDNEAQHFSPKLKARRPETGGWIRGKAALREWWEDSFSRFKILRYELVRLTPHENRVFMEYIRQAPGEDNLYVGEMLEIKEGLIVTSSVFHR